MKRLTKTFTGPGYVDFISTNYLHEGCVEMCMDITTAKKTHQKLTLVPEEARIIGEWSIEWAKECGV